MPVRIYPDPDSSNELSGTYYGYQDSDSEDDTPDASKTQLREIGHGEIPGYFSEINDCLFPSALTPYPFPVDTPEQEVHYQFRPA